jgi:hypothetical protein
MFFLEIWIIYCIIIIYMIFNRFQKNLDSFFIDSYIRDRYNKLDYVIVRRRELPAYISKVNLYTQR